MYLGQLTVAVSINILVVENIPDIEIHVHFVKFLK